MSTLPTPSLPFLWLLLTKAIASPDYEKNSANCGGGRKFAKRK